MHRIIINVEESRYALLLQFLKTLDYVMVVQPTPALIDSAPFKKGYDFSDLAGRLEWKGDAIGEQRRLRDEW